MGRRGNMRSRPGILFIIIFAVCLAIVYLSWRSMSPSIKSKENYSVQMQSLLEDRGKWRNAGQRHEGESHDERDSIDREVHDRDPDYDLEDNNQPKKVGVDTNSNQKDMQDFKKSNTQQDNNNKQAVTKSVESLGTVKGFYRQPNGLITDTVKSMERYVHLDLKGAPPKMSYFRDFIPLVKKLGATGLLIEYEDMFPFSGKLKDIGVSAKNAYPMTDIKELLQLAKVNNLKVMPLIQTFGHMEFILKSNFMYLRESAYTPQVIDITKNSTYLLISEIVKQILDAHPDATHLHIGCDEVYELGKGNSAIEMQNSKLSEGQLFLRHVQRVASIVRNYNGRNVAPVMWDDELRKISAEEIMLSKLPSVVEIMVWHYTRFVAETIGNTTWDKYAKLFKFVWIASAFKGATGARQYFTEPQYHIQNHFSWLDVIAANKNKIEFKGIALTGWQRYDHFATLCELLPVSIPSLAVCLATMTYAGFTENIHTAASKVILCSEPIEMSFPLIDKKTGSAIVSQDCRFPGHELYHASQELYGHIEGNPSIKHRIDGWLSDYQIAHHFSSPGQLRVLSKALTKQNSELSMVSIPIKKSLDNIYFEDTVDEWMNEHIIERQKHNGELQGKIQTLMIIKTWPVHPLPTEFNKKRNIVNDADVNNKNVDDNINKNNNAKVDQDEPQKRLIDYQRKQYAQNQTGNGNPSDLRYQNNPQQRNQFSPPLKLKINETAANFKDDTVTRLAGKNPDLTKINDQKFNNKEENLNRKQLKDLNDGDDRRQRIEEIKRRQLGNQISDENNKIDGINKENEFKPKIVFPADTRDALKQQSQLRNKFDNQSQKLTDKDKQGANQQFDERDKYLLKDKNDISDRRDNTNLKYQNSFGGKDPQRENSDLTINLLKERFQRKQKIGKEYSEI